MVYVCSFMSYSDSIGARNVLISDNGILSIL
jgi:hypothetical protein